ncbi:phosphotransferase enzyme family protein [Nonomuraea angiospora]|uniref:phosphotransferase enzyme family protein n=1 Tax=Nonomuraea angiospora TaxID=46172 RepID=UPI00299FF7ED|nr:phosphotransferase [Nonomuraea angiospora]MDX3110259.1 phosphotransferase [Nonomuraea angiospora]
MGTELGAYVREAFGWDADVVVSAGPRGALGQIWRLDVGPARYALKEIFGEPPSEALIEAELAFGRRAAEAGVRLPAGHRDRDGRHLLRAPGGGTWLRLYDWVDLRPVDLAARATPGELGALLARLHRCAPAAATEPDGGPPAAWYHQVPAEQEWPRVENHQAPADEEGPRAEYRQVPAEEERPRAVCPQGPAERDWRRAGVAWAGRLAERVATLPELCAAVAPADPAELIVCHRDLHPENVLADPSGALVVVDWDNLGPAAPGRELARALFDWFCDGPDADLDAMRAMYEAYVREDGPGRIRQAADFSMLLASRLNFLLVQTRVALDPGAERRHREWAEREIDEALRILPTPRQLADVLALTASR